MNAFHGDPKIKQFYLERVRNHRLNDELIKGKYWEDGRGCGIGCTVHSSSHAAYETELGIPRIIARLEDITFERLTNGLAIEWPERFLEAIPVSADLSMVWPKYSLWLLVDGDYAVIRHAKKENARKAIEEVAALYRRWVETDEKPSADDFLVASKSDAYAADAAAAYDAAAADAAADAAAAAIDRFWRASADKLIGLLGAAPVYAVTP